MMPVRRRDLTPPHVVRAVEDMEWHVSLDLGLRKPGEVPWMLIDFVPQHEGDWHRRLGRYLHEVRIEIRAMRDAAEAVRVLIHEYRHAWQHLNMSTDAWADKATKEADCRAYEYEALERFYRPHLRYVQRLEPAAQDERREITRARGRGGTIPAACAL